MYIETTRRARSGPGVLREKNLREFGVVIFPEHHRQTAWEGCSREVLVGMP